MDSIVIDGLKIEYDKELVIIHPEKRRIIFLNKSNLLQLLHLMDCNIQAADEKGVVT